MKTSSCQTCSKPIELDSMFGSARWVDPSNLDEFDNGTICETSGDLHVPGEVRDDEPDCRSCGDRVGGCSRCTDPVRGVV